MTGQLVGYVRVSSVDQNTDRQLDGVELDERFEDKASGKDTSRPQLQAALKYVRKGDTLVVHSMDRLARSLRDLLAIVDELTGRGVAVRFVKEGLTFTADSADPCAVLMLQVMGAVAQFERSMIGERQREGIAKARERGVYKGRRESLTDEQKASVRTRRAAGEHPVDLAKAFGVSRAKIYNVLKEGG